MLLNVGMYIARIPNRGSPPTILLRESYRQGGQVKTRTLANLSKLPPAALAGLRRLLRGETLVPVEEAFQVVASPHHGHVLAVLTAMRRLNFANLIASRRSRQRDLTLAMVASRLLMASSKLATTRWWQLSTLPLELGLGEADENDLYQAMDWLLGRQDRIQKKLADRHLAEGGIALFDLTSSYFEGVCCPLAALGHNRDAKKGKLQVNYGLLTDERGRPLSVSVFRGNTADPTTLLPQVEQARRHFGLQQMVIVGDRGMITQKQIDALRDLEGMDWIAALRPEAIKKLVASGSLQIGLFDQRNLFEVTHPDFPNERLVACRNPELAQRRAQKRQSLLEATARELEKVRRMAWGDRLRGRDNIGARVRSILSKYRIGKHYRIDVWDDGFDFQVDENRLQAEARIHGAEDARLVVKRLALYQRHVEAIGRQLGKVRQRIERGRLYGRDKIGVRVGRVLNKYKVGKHFKLEIREDGFDFEVDQQKVDVEAALDGIYVVRTSLPEERMEAQDAVRSYKLLGRVESAFRAFKSIDLKVRPIHHHLEDRVRAHIFLCMLAYYVQWHMIEAWRPLLFADEDQEAKATRDPVAPAKRSQAAQRKVRSKTLDDGSQVHSFHTLLVLLSGIVRNVCIIPSSGPEAPTFDVFTTPNAKQQRALDLLHTIQV